VVKKYLWRNRHDKPNVRIKGKVFPIRDQNDVWHEPDTPEGDRIYWEILTGKRAEAKRSWSAAIVLLRASDRWADLSPRYRADLDPVLAYIEEKIGTRDVARLTQADIYAAMDANKHRVRFANYLPVAISMIFKVVVRRRWMTDNPAAGIEKLRVPKDRQKPHVPWTDQAVQTIREHGEPVPRLIFELGVGSVQRPGDLVDFVWGDFDGEALRLRQNKSGKPLWLPCTPQLLAALSTAKKALGAAPHPSRHILTKQDGQPMNYRRMARIFGDERKRLGLEAHDMHALRYRGVMELAWSNCTDDEIMAFSGHSSKAMVIKYAGIARQITRAKTALEKRRLWSAL
jgi:integrase